MSSVKERSFWSTTSGVVTGVAGTLTGIVGIIGIAAQMGWIGSDGDSSEPSSVQTEGSTVAGSPNAGSGGTGSRSSASPSGSGSGSGTAAPTFTVDPTRLTFDALTRKATVKVVNSGSVPMTVQSPTLSGSNPTQFSATAPTCTREALNPGRSCEVEVTFTPSRGGSYSATLAVQVTGARAQEVSLSGTSVL